MLNKGKDELGAEPLPCNGEMKPRHLVLSKVGKEKKGLMLSSLRSSLVSLALCRTAQHPPWAADQDSSQAGNTSAMSVRMESPFCAKSNTKASQACPDGSSLLLLVSLSVQSAATCTGSLLQAIERP